MYLQLLIFRFGKKIILSGQNLAKMAFKKYFYCCVFIRIVSDKIVQLQ